MRLVFMGTPDIAATALAALLDAGHEIAGVYTRRDKPVGRKQVVVPSPVKALAVEKGLPLFQPKTLRTEGAAEELAALEPELVVVVAYGLLLPAGVLAVPKYGCINLHVSLLPRYRGAAPIQWAVINGEKETGVTIMQLDEGLDSGPVIAIEAFAILPQDTAGQVFEKATDVGARLLVETVAEIARNGVRATPQTGEPTLAPRLEKQMAELDFARPAEELHNLVRGCNPWPMAWFVHGGKRIKVEAALLPGPESGAGQGAGSAPGQVLEVSPLTVACGQGALQLCTVLPEGSRRMTGAEWAAGRRFKPGDML